CRWRFASHGPKCFRREPRPQPKAASTTFADRAVTPRSGTAGAALADTAETPRATAPATRRADTRIEGSSIELPGTNDTAARTIPRGRPESRALWCRAAIPLRAF